jgi:hypothetical protein
MARKSAVVEEIEDLELEEEDLEVDDDEDEDEAPAAKKKAKGRKAPAATKGTDGYGISWLVDYVNETLDVDTTPAALRVLLRKLAADGVIAREVGEDRTRYSFSGEGDKTVKLVLKAIRGGALTKAKTDNLAAARAAKAAKKQNAVAPAKKSKVKAEDDEDAAPAKATRRRRSA